MTITLLAQSGDTLAYTPVAGDPTTAQWDSALKTLTLSGAATKVQYEQALEAVTFSVTGGALLVRTVSVSVTDDAGVGSLLPGTVLAVHPLPPLVTPVGAVFQGAGDAAVNPISLVDILDADSDNMFVATVRISGNYAGRSVQPR